MAGYVYNVIISRCDVNITEFVDVPCVHRVVVTLQERQYLAFEIDDLQKNLTILPIEFGLRIFLTSIALEFQAIAKDFRQLSFKGGKVNVKHMFAPLASLT